MDTTVWKKYSEEFGARFTKRQKTKFQNALIEDFKQFGYTCDIVQGKSLLSRANNLLFGNLKHAKTVIAVPYDTPAKVLWPKSYFFPLDGMSTSNKSLISTFAPVLILYLAVMAIMYGMEGLTSKLTSVVLGFVLLLILFIFYLMLHGVSNKKNYNRNSAGIYAAYKLAESLDKDTKRQVAFLFLDSNKTKHLGAKAAAEDFLRQGKNPNVIVLNTFAKGTLQIGYNGQNKKLAQDLNKKFPNAQRVKMIALTNEMRNSSPMEHFAKAVTIGAGELDKKNRLCVMGTGTGKDVEIDEENINKVVDMLQAYVK